MSKSFSYPVWNILHLERGAREPLQGQIFHQLRTAITIGQIERGARLPPSRMLAKELGIARNTVTNIYDRLAAEGYLLHKVGAGTFVEAILPEDYQTKGGQQVSPRASPMAPSQRGQAILAMQVPWGRMDQFALSPGLPALDQFPFERFAELSAQHWRSRTTIDLGYGEGGGLHALKEQIALYLREARGVCCDAEQVIIVSHTLQALTLVTQVLLDSGDSALVEDPSYIAELANLRAAGIRPISVPIDAEGLDLSATDVTAERARLAVATPVGQFPFGSTMSMARRQALLDWAYANDAWIFEDDVNSEIRWSGVPLPPLASLDRRGHVIYTSSFNRVLAPGLRLGYLVVPHDLIDAFTMMQQAFSSHVPLPLQKTVADFMAQGHLASHMRRMRAIYRERAETLTEGLRRELGDWLEVPDVPAGLYLTAVAKEPVDDVAISNAALRLGLDVPPLSRYCVSGRVLAGFIFGFGNTPASRIPHVVRSFAALVRAGSGALPGIGSMPLR